ncbi:GNAT family acetyltransferase [Roseibium sp.]|uniref:GNAT family acetyltransferase n=1 Tax=Roseibium sp. TaxID=1936156 RepID=UPI003A97E740
MSDAVSEAVALEIVEFQEPQRAAVIALWQASGLVRPWNDADKDINRKLTDPVGRLFVVLDGAAVVGSVMVGYDGHRGTIYYLAVHPDHQSAGLGRRLMAHCEAYLLALGCPKINLLVRRGNDKARGFYDALGFSEDEAVSLGKRLIPDV